MTHTDLREFVSAPGPYLSIAIPTPSRVGDAAHRLEIRWKNVVSQIGVDVDGGWTAADVDALEALGDELHHGAGAAVIVLHRHEGPTLVEFIDEPVQDTMAHDGPLPRLAPLIEARQRAVAHVVVETDRAGADLTAFDGGSALASETVEGERLHIHRGHPGGWSQRRFQQRAENTWEDNARLVAQQTATLARSVGAEVVFVAGEVRARSLLVDELDGVHDVPDVVGLESGSPDTIADDVVRELSDRVARRVRDLAERVREAAGDGRATTDTAETLAALAEARVDTLLVHDDVDVHGETTDRVIAGLPAGARAVDVAIAAALVSDAEIVVVPKLAVMDGPLAATLRW
jgi:hypothetical protein